mgnify:FL=1
MIDVIVCHVCDLLYPQWMYRMNKDRDLFGKIIVMMTQKSDDRDYTDYLKSHIKAQVISEYRHDSPDWRDSAIKEALFETRGDRVLFLEQDFIVEDGFFKKLFELDYDLGSDYKYVTIGLMDGNRFHPACLLVKQTAIARTRRDFSVDTDVGDHFYKFSQDLEKIGNWVSLKNLNLPKNEHISGLTQNFRLTKNFHHPKRFYDYLMESLEYDQPDDWRLFTISKAKEVKNAA